MSRSAARHDAEPFRGGPLIPILFFITPLLTAIAPRLAPFLLLILVLVLIVAGLRRGVPWRALFQPNAAMIALAAVASYAALSAIWAAEPGEALSKGALLLGVTFVVFAAATAITSLDSEQIRRAALAFVAGSLGAALFVTIELVTGGALTRGVMNVIPALQPGDAKRVRIVDGRVTRMNMAELNQNVAMVAFQLWPGLLALSTLLQGTRRRLLGALFFLALAVPIGLSQHDSSQIGLIASALILVFSSINERAVTKAPLWPALASRSRPSASPTRPSCINGLAADFRAHASSSGIHRRARARTPLAWHRRRLDTWCESGGCDAAEAAQGLRASAHHRAPRAQSFPANLV
jgi:hypothetical protein